MVKFFVAPKACLAQVGRTPHAEETREPFELMDRNERTSDFPPEVMADLRALITPFRLRAYPEPAALYAKLAAWLNLPRDMVLVTMAADGGLRAVFETFVEAGDEVLSATPSYAMYPIYSGLAGAVSRVVPFTEDLQLPLAHLLERITDRTKVVVLANPNQPIERVYQEQELRELLETCARYHTLLVLDEAYYHFCPLTAAPLLQEYGNLVIVRTFSKAFGIAGVRLGYLLSRPENIHHLRKVRPMYEAHALGIAIGCYVLDHEFLMRDYVAQVQESRAFLVAGLRELGFGAEGQWGNSVLVSLPRELPAREVAETLKARGFLVRAETQFPLVNHLRVTVGPKAQVVRFLEAFTAVAAVPRGAPS